MSLYSRAMAVLLFVSFDEDMWPREADQIAWLEARQLPYSHSGSYDSADARSWYAYFINTPEADRIVADKARKWADFEGDGIARGIKVTIS